MDIIFAGKLAKIMNSAKARQQVYGALAKSLGRRLDDLRALRTLDEAYRLPGHFEALVGDRAGEYSMRLSANHRLMLRPATTPLPQRADGGIDLARVDTIEILGVEDYHRK